MRKATSGKSEVQSPESKVQGPADSVVRLSILVACAAVLQVAESLLPHPLPGVRLGLANIITVIAMVYIGPGSAIQLAVLRTLVSSMVLGTFLTPTFVLSFSGGVVSALVMVVLYRLSRGGGPFRFSLIGISVGGAVSHILTQVALVYLLFIRSSGVLLLWPWLALSAVVTGVVTGMIAVQAVRRLDTGQAASSTQTVLSAPSVPSTPPNSAIRRVRPEAKIAAVMVVGLAVVIFSSYQLYAAVFLMLAVFTALARVRVSRLLSGLKRVWVLLVVALAMPVVFSPWGRVFLAIGPVRVTDQGLSEGAVFAARILLLFFATTLLAQTTAPHEVAGGLEKLLQPLRVFRVKPGRLARSLSLSWLYFPQLWQSVRTMVGESRGRKGWLDRTIHLPGDVVADLYFTADRLAGSASEAPNRQPSPGGFPPPPDRP